jgi:hypothetical protein
VLSGECDFNRVVTKLSVGLTGNLGISPAFKVKFQLNMTLWHKNVGGNFRQLMDLKQVDVCNTIENFEKFPMLSNSTIWINQTFPGFVHPCPYTVSLSYEDSTEDFKRSTFFSLSLS